MQITAVKCPNCSGDIKYTPGQELTRCPYCDSVLDIKAESDADALEKTKNEFKNSEHIRYDYGKRLQHWKNTTYLYYGMVFLLTIFAFLVTYIFESSDGYKFGEMILFVVLISFIAVPAVLSKKLPTPPKEVEKTLSVKAGLPVAVKMAITALLFALAGAFISVLLDHINIL
ncbi:Na+-dependent bicarbonate transporter superfamily protein [Ruminococcus albus]|uniref:Na+-dependent bicarbonate transporter superfamily protein n=1 Tax=Ruminococcus albus TaxID=1264 RepID=A0A1I1DDU8_RUMAL|nr:Na+-dependent bicarbonate transporter superfamily protein [Ruminococcus albus]